MEFSDIYLYVYNCAGDKQHLVVKPRDGAFQEGWGSVRFLDNVVHLPRTSEEKLVLAVLGGHIDATKLSLPASMSKPLHSNVNLCQFLCTIFLHKCPI